MDRFKTLQDRLIKFRDDRDWGQFHTPKNLATSVSIEAAELLECFQWSLDNDITKLDLEHIAEEMSDVLNYLMLLADRLDIDLIDSALKKIDKNKLKYPVEKSKGKSDKYTTL